MIRKAELKDVESIHKLNQNELGYEFDFSATQTILEKLMNDTQHVILVYELNGEAVGYVHAQLYETLYFPSLYNILGAAVQEAKQQQGIGKALITAIENHARENHVSGIRLNSGESRVEAHRFYESLGYTSNKLQKRYIKYLG